jgi:uncharacterized membrane protein YvlD (DUF360 family)
MIPKFLRSIMHFFVVWFIDTISLLVVSQILSSINFITTSGIPVFSIAVAAAFVLGIVNFLIRPLLLLIAVRLGAVVVFITGFFLNSVALLITSALMNNFEVTNFWGAFIGGILLSLVNTIISTILTIDEEDSFYDHMVQRMAARQARKIEPGEGRGLVILETDGLSFQRIQKAIADGYMPTLKQMIEEEGYKISRQDCGMPPTTPACQAGILLGNNHNIPAFRWLDKSTGKLLAGGGAAEVMEPLLSDGNGLLRGGSSIGNMFSGDAAKSILTFSKLRSGTDEDKQARARDMYLLMRNPYFFTRVLVLTFGDMILEIWQGWRQKSKGVQPRLNRLHNGYPLLRSAINVFLRDICTYFTILDIIRGVPAIYTLYAGYDEIAHHSGPYYSDTNLTLQQFDTQVARLRRVIREKAKRPFEILILSDHGQSWGPTFKQRYGISILDFIKGLLPQEISVEGSVGGDDGSYTVAAMMDEMQNIQDSNQGSKIGRAALNQTQQLMNSNLQKNEAYQEKKSSNVTLAYGGNGALVYFDLFPRRITLNELNAAYPGMVDMLVNHEGIGFVVAYEDDYTPVMFSKNGARNLHTGVVVGNDPLLPFGDVDLRTWQLRRLADFENSGDLILNSTLYPDGTVAALEELIGNHGGLGGEQTDAYLFHPGDMLVPETRNAYEFKAILDSRRGLPGPTPIPERPFVPQVNPWAGSSLLKGIGQVGKWLRLTAGAISLNRDAYKEIAADALMTAPALLIALMAALLASLNNQKSFDVLDILVRYVFWFVGILIMQVAVRILRGKEKVTTTLRVSGFAYSASILELLGFFPIIYPIAHLLAQLLSFFGMWIGIAAAHKLHGWRAFLLPVIFMVVLIVGTYFISTIIHGGQLVINELLSQAGWQPQP